MMNILKLLMLYSVIVFFAAGTAHAADIKKGRALFNDSSLGTNGKSCNSCHSGGKDIDGSQNTFTILGSELDSREDAINFCIKMALSGRPLNKDSEKMEGLVSYIKTLKPKKKRIEEAPGY